MPAASADAGLFWLDEGEVDPTWAAPTGPDRRLPPAAVYLVLLVALGLLVALVWGVGGFERRTDTLVDTPVGSPVVTGPYELRFTGATAQRTTRFDNTVSWEVRVVGEGRTTGDVSIAPDYSGTDAMFVARDPRSGEVQTPDSQRFRDGEATFGGSFTPGLPLQPLTEVFEFSQHYRPGGELVFVVYQLEFTDTSLLGNQDERWNNTDTGYRFRVPLEVLPPETS